MDLENVLCLHNAPEEGYILHSYWENTNAGQRIIMCIQQWTLLCNRLIFNTLRQESSHHNKVETKEIYDQAIYTVTIINT